jgi:photosystem II stability/assembly factor-like uncharacterized protein
VLFRSWTQKLSVSQSILNSLYFIDQNTGYATGIGNLSSLIYKTTDAGENWKKQITFVSDGLKKVYFTDAMTGYIVGSNGTLLKTVTGGE